MGKNPGRKGKYSAALAEEIFTCIAVHGSDRRAYEQADISHKTFYEWIQKKSDFREGIALAREEYRRTRPDYQLRLAHKAIDRYLRGEVVEEWTIEKVVESERMGRTVETSTKAVRKECPQWVINRVLGEPYDEIDALKVLAKAGWIPAKLLNYSREQLEQFRANLRSVFAETLPELDKLSTEPGLSQEMAGAIRGEILGLEPEDTTPLSKEMDGGPVSDQDNREVAADRNLMG